MRKSISLPVKKDRRVEFPHTKPLELNDKQFIQSFTQQYHPFSCEYAFANLFSWNKQYHYTWCIYAGRLVIYNGVESQIYMPLGEKMTPAELYGLSYDFTRMGWGGTVTLVPEEYVRAYPEVENIYTVISNRSLSEYIYSARALFELNGPKLHKKRNLISQFKRTHPHYHVEMLSRENLKECRVFADRLRRKLTRIDRSIKEENTALKQALDAFEALDLEGLLLQVDGQTVAFSIYSRLNPLMYVTHFEKSDFSYKGASQLINQETAGRLLDKCKFINREQDLGLPGLRQAKLSYAPERLYHAYTLIPKIAASRATS